MVFISHIPDGAEGGVCFAALQHKTFTLFVYNYKTQKGNNNNVELKDAVQVHSHFTYNVLL